MLSTQLFYENIKYFPETYFNGKMKSMINNKKSEGLKKKKYFQ